MLWSSCYPAWLKYGFRVCAGVYCDCRFSEKYLVIIRKGTSFKMLCCNSIY